MKLASIFLTASAVYFRGFPQRYEQTSKKYEACFNIFYSECIVFPLFSNSVSVSRVSFGSLGYIFGPVGSEKQ